MLAFTWLVNTGLIVGLVFFMNRFFGGTDINLIQPVHFFGLFAFTLVICMKEMGIHSLIGALRTWFLGDKKHQKDYVRFSQLSRLAIWDGALVFTILGLMRIVAMPGLDFRAGMPFCVLTLFYSGLLWTIMPRDTGSTLSVQHHKGLVTRLGAFAAVLVMVLYVSVRADLKVGAADAPGRTTASTNCR